MKRLLLLFVGVSLGVTLAWFAVRFLSEWVMPISCILLLVVVGGWFIWIYRGGLKK